MLAAVQGGTVEDQIGRTVEEVVPALWPTLEPLYERVINSGRGGGQPRDVGPDRRGPAPHPLLAHQPEPGHRGRLRHRHRHRRHRHHRAQAAGGEPGDAHPGRRRRSLGVRRDTRPLHRRSPGAGGDALPEPWPASSVSSPREIEAIELAAKIHDIGKLSVPSELLTRPGRLSEPEMALVRTHCQAGYDLLERVHFPDHVAKMVLQHHERCDGSGYPLGVQRRSRSSSAVGSSPWPTWSNRWRPDGRIGRPWASAPRSTRSSGAAARCTTRASSTRAGECSQSDGIVLRPGGRLTRPGRPPPALRSEGLPGMIARGAGRASGAVEPR